MARVTTEVDVQIANDRLRGNNAWNGQGLLVHLALTSRKDSSRSWMVPLKTLCEAIVDAHDEGQVVELTDEQEQTIDELIQYSHDFQSALSAEN
jgi:hypothetical protein